MQFELCVTVKSNRVLVVFFQMFSSCVQYRILSEDHYLMIPKVLFKAKK